MAPRIHGEKAFDDGLDDAGTTTRAAPAGAIDVPPRGRLVLECIECEEPVSWPVTKERSSRSIDHARPPEAGQLRIIEPLGDSRRFITAIESTRMPTTASVKQARTCSNGHFIGNMRTEPHGPPFHMQFSAVHITWRLIDP